MKHHASVLSISASMVLFALLLFGVIGVQVQNTTTPTPTPSEGYPNAQLLVETEWLAEHLNDENVRIIDMRSEDVYTDSHVPGAVNVPVDDIVASVDGVPFEFDREKVQVVLNQIGLTPEMTVVVYDNLGMMTSARMFWTLEYVGHDDVRVLNGGWNAWEMAELKTTGEVPELEQTEYPIDLEPNKLVDAGQVLERLDDPDVIIVDARSPQEYTGETSFSERAGHIPGAVNLVWLDVLTGGDVVYATESGWAAELRDEDVEVFKPASEIETLLQDLQIMPDKQVITYCQTLWRGAHVYFLLRLMGYEDVRGYDGSWAEWGNRSDYPIVEGSEPGSLETAVTPEAGE